MVKQDLLSAVKEDLDLITFYNSNVSLTLYNFLVFRNDRVFPTNKHKIEYKLIS